MTPCYSATKPSQTSQILCQMFPNSVSCSFNFLSLCTSSVPRAGAHGHLEGLSREGHAHRAGSQHCGGNQLQSCARGHVLLPSRNNTGKGCQRGHGQYCVKVLKWFKLFWTLTSWNVCWPDTSKTGESLSPNLQYLCVVVVFFFCKSSQGCCV